MNPNLERLIRLQQLDAAARAAEQRVSEEPAHQRAFDARLDGARGAVASAKERVADNQNARRAVEKELAVHQGRLSKFREQAMSVKTNQEYHAIQHEIAFAESQIKGLEEQILERMIEADDLNAALKAAEAGLAAEQKKVEAERRTLTDDLKAVTASLAGLSQERLTLASQIDKSMLATFEMVSRVRSGVGMAEARSGICTICHVRLRPQVFNTVMRNQELLQCDYCNRILYYVPPPPSAPAEGTGQPTS